MGVSHVTVKKLEKLASKPENRQVCSEDMTNNDLWLAAHIFLVLCDEALKTCISKYHECSFSIHKKTINLLEINTLKPFEAPPPNLAYGGGVLGGRRAKLSF